MIEMLKCREKIYNNKIKHFYSVAPKKIISHLSFSLIGANGSLLDFFVWSPAYERSIVCVFVVARGHSCISWPLTPPSAGVIAGSERGQWEQGIVSTEVAV